MAFLDVINERFGIPDQLEFEKGPGGLPVARIENEHAFVRIALHGAHVLSFLPHGQDELLWLSRRSFFVPGKPIRGGIPICWPWFAAHPADSSAPSHGFARISTWHMASTNRTPDGQVSVQLKLRPDHSTRSLWPHEFELSATFTVGRSLDVSFEAVNKDEHPLVFGAALHSYFVVADVGTISVRGLEAAKHVNTIDGSRVDAENAPIRIDRETDRVYLETEDAVEIEDPLRGRTIRVEKRGSRSTVVWNPWTDKARRLGDLGEDQFRDFVCVETANALDDVRTVDAGARHVIGTTISVV